MSGFRRLFRLALLQRPSATEVADELAFHLEERTAELIAQGMEPAAARRNAEQLFGDEVAYRQACLEIDHRRARNTRRADVADTLLQDVGRAARALARRPGFTVAALAVLALGIGSSTAVFSLVDAVLLRPLPYHAPDSLYLVRGSTPSGDFGLSERERQLYREPGSPFAGIGAWTPGIAIVTGGSAPEQVDAAYVDAAVLPLAGMVPWRGRVFAPAEDRPGEDGVVLLSHAFWQYRFGAQADVLDSTIVVNGAARRVIGILPAEARLPTDYTGNPPQVYLPLALPDAAEPRNLHYLHAIARVPPSLSPAQLEQRLTAFADAVAAQLPTLPAGFRIELTAVPDAVLGPHRPAVLLLFAAVGLLLLLACANLAGLLLANAEARQREFAVQSALGAGRGRLARQLFAEALALSVVGGLAGVMAAGGWLRVFARLAPNDLPRADMVALDGRVLLFAVGATLLTALLAGGVPALRLDVHRLADALRTGGRGTKGSRDRHALRRGLVLGEIALAIAIATGAGLVVRSWLRLLGTDAGFTVRERLTLQVRPPIDEYETREMRWQFFDRTLESVRSVPGVKQAGAVDILPLDREAGDWSFFIDGRPPVPKGERNPFGDRLIVTDGYFEAMGIALRQGRLFEAIDRADQPPVVLVNESLARRYWPAADPVGERIRLTTDLDPAWRTIIGVVGDVRSRGLEREPRPELYLPYRQYPASDRALPPATMHVVMHTAGAPAGVAGAVARAVRGVDGGAVTARVRTMDAVVGTTLAVRRFQLVVLGFFAASGIALVAFGVYGVIAFLVQQRTAEFGVRMALGADRRRILRLVLRDGLVLGLPGAAVGMLAAMAGGRLLEGLLYQVSAGDPLVLVSVPLLVLAVVVVAALSPALRAARTDPGTSLRGD